MTEAELWAKRMKSAFKGIFTRREREHYLAQEKARLEKNE